MLACRASLRRLAPSGTSSSVFRFRNLTLGINLAPGKSGRFCPHYNKRAPGDLSRLGVSGGPAALTFAIFGFAHPGQVEKRLDLAGQTKQIDKPLGFLL